VGASKRTWEKDTAMETQGRSHRSEPLKRKVEKGDRYRKRARRKGINFKKVYSNAELENERDQKNAGPRISCGNEHKKDQDRGVGPQDLLKIASLVPEQKNLQKVITGGKVKEMSGTKRAYRRKDRISSILLV